MDGIHKESVEGVSLIKVKEETKRVLEAFLKRSLAQDDRTHTGHVGRTFHDPKKYSSGPNQDDRGQGSTKKSKKRSKEPLLEKDDPKGSPKLGPKPSLEQNGTWNSLHERINDVEEKKHGFQTSIKKLLRRHSQTKDKASLKGRSGSLHSKSKESLDNVLDEPKKVKSKSDSMKRQKFPNALVACTMANSVDSLTVKEKEVVEASDKPSSQSKLGRPFTFKNILKKKSNKTPVFDAPAPMTRPNFLPISPCYPKDAQHHAEKVDDSEIYDLAAEKLDHLVRHKVLKSPVGSPQPLGKRVTGESVKHPIIEDSNAASKEGTATEDKEDVIRKLVLLLQEQAIVINDKIEKDPFLRNALNRMSYGSFSRLAEVFTSHAEVAACENGGSVSPELTKIALTMELTRKVAGINSHAVHTLMGYSLQYMDMFVPWLQKQGGWENIVSQGDLPDFQID
ncbi:bcl-2-like protein 12 [Pelodytes ibericus]